MLNIIQICGYDKDTQREWAEEAKRLIKEVLNSTEWGMDRKRYIGENTVIRIDWNPVELCIDSRPVVYVHIMSENAGDANEIKDALRNRGLTFKFVATGFLTGFRGSVSFK